MFLFVLPHRSLLTAAPHECVQTPAPHLRPLCAGSSPLPHTAIAAEPSGANLTVMSSFPC